MALPETSLHNWAQHTFNHKGKLFELFSNLLSFREQRKQHCCNICY